ncbi:hypothetical protein [Streptomyces purpureus]|uniref:hypothetical protein n=1 Tax=Streptomyces purpureus TaxID=1951 RepID=UPI000376CDDB|nr:hypothetical protein [Streptomyces purpureus]
MTEPPDWSALRHAYGPADDIPGLFTAMGSADEAVREQAMEELVSSLFHQGDIYSASAAALPELARLALHGPGHRTGLLWLIGGCAGGAASREERAAMDHAVAETLPTLLPLATDEDPGVRQAMVWLIASAGLAALPLMPLLRARFDIEQDADVRADLATALGLLDLDDRARTVRDEALLDDPEPRVRLAAATDLLRTAALPLPADLVGAALDAYAEHPVQQYGEVWPAPYRTLGDRLLDDPDAALRGIDRGLPLAMDVDATWRDRERELLPHFTAGIEHPYQLQTVARLAAQLPGGADAPYLDPFLDPRRAADHPDLRVAAVLAAVRLRTPGALGHVLRLLDDLPDHDMTAAVLTAAVEVFGAAAEPVAAKAADRPRAAWADALVPFPALVAHCESALVRLLPHSADALAVLGAAATPATVGTLREAAHDGSTRAAFAYARLTGDHTPALTLARRQLAEEKGRWALHVAGRLGPAATELLPLIEPHLTTGSRETRAAAAAALWRVTGRTHDTAGPLATLIAHADNLYEHHFDALRALAEMRLLPDTARPAAERIAHSPRRAASQLFDNGTPHIDYTARALATTVLDHAGPDRSDSDLPDR